MISNIAKWMINGITQKILISYLNKYIKNSVIIDLFHNDGINFKNINLNIDNINNKISEIINDKYIEYCNINNIKDYNEDINQISINDTFIKELIVSFSENYIIIKGLNVNSSITSLKVKQKSNLVNSQTLNEDAEFMDAEDDNNNFENNIKQYLENKQENNQETSKFYNINFNKLHLLLEDINVIITNKNGYKILLNIGYFELQNNINNKIEVINNISIDNVKVSLIGLNNNIYKVLNFKNKGVINLKFSNTINIFLNLISSSLKVYLNNTLIQTLLSLLKELNLLIEIFFKNNLQSDLLINFQLAVNQLKFKLYENKIELNQDNNLELNQGDNQDNNQDNNIYKFSFYKNNKINKTINFIIDNLEINYKQQTNIQFNSMLKSCIIEKENNNKNILFKVEDQLQLNLNKVNSNLELKVLLTQTFIKYDESVISMVYNFISNLNFNSKINLCNKLISSYILQVPLIDITFDITQLYNKHIKNNLLNIENQMKINFNISKTTIIKQDKNNRFHLQFKEGYLDVYVNKVKHRLINIKSSETSIPSLDITSKQLIEINPKISIITDKKNVTFPNNKRFLDKIENGLNIVFSNPFLLYSSIPSLTSEEYFNFDWNKNFQNTEYKYNLILPQLNIDIYHFEITFINYILNLFNPTNNLYSLLFNSNLDITIRNEDEEYQTFKENNPELNQDNNKENNPNNPELNQDNNKENNPNNPELNQDNNKENYPNNPELNQTLNYFKSIDQDQFINIRHKTKYIKIISDDFAFVIISGLSSNDQKDKGFIISSVLNTFSCSGYNFLNDPITILRTREYKDYKTYINQLPLLSILTGELKLSYIHQKLLLKPLIWVPSIETFNFIKSIFNFNLPLQNINKKSLLHFKVNQIILYVKLNCNYRENCIIIPIYNIYLKDLITDLKQVINIYIESIQGFHTNINKPINIINHSRETDYNNFYKYLIEKEEFTLFLKNEKDKKQNNQSLCNIQVILKDKSYKTNNKQLILSHFNLDFSNTIIQTYFTPDITFNLYSIINNYDKINTILFGYKPEPKIYINPLIIDDYTSNKNDKDYISKSIILLDETKEKKYNSYTNNQTENNEDDNYNDDYDNYYYEDDFNDKMKQLEYINLYVNVSNFTLNSFLYFDKHNYYNKSEYIHFNLTVDKFQYYTLDNNEQLKPFNVNLEVNNFYINCNLNNCNWKKILYKDIERLEKWKQNFENNSINSSKTFELQNLGYIGNEDKEEKKQDNFQELNQSIISNSNNLNSSFYSNNLSETLISSINTETDNININSSQINKLSSNFFNKNSNILKLQVSSRIKNNKSYVLNVKTRIQPIMIYLKQKVLSFIFEFKKLGFPLITNTSSFSIPKIKIHNKFLFEEVQIMPIKVKFNYQSQSDAPIPIFNDSSNYKWVFISIPSIHNRLINCKEFHYVAPEDRLGSFTSLKESLIYFYYPSLVNVLDIAGSLGPVQLVMKFFKETIKVIHTDINDKDLTSLSMISNSFNVVAVQTMNLSSKSFLGVVKFLHWADKEISKNDTQQITSLNNTPENIINGLKDAGFSIYNGITSAFEGVIKLPIDKYNKKGLVSSLNTLTRNIPGLVIRPVVGFGDAMIKIMFSLRNTMDPNMRIKDMEPYDIEEK